MRVEEGRKEAEVLDKGGDGLRTVVGELGRERLELRSTCVWCADATFCFLNGKQQGRIMCPSRQSGLVLPYRLSPTSESTPASPPLVLGGLTARK